MPLQVIITKDGSHSLYDPNLKETYHSLHGAITESQYVFIQQGFEPTKTQNTTIDILEVGFGTGLNAILAFAHAFNNN